VSTARASFKKLARRPLVQCDDLDAETRRALRKLYRETGDHDHVFVSERGSPMAREGFQRLVERAGKAAGIDFAVHPHMLRHACGYRLANEGKDAFAIQGYMGHQSLEMTKEYVALSADRFKDW
jgi:site-specific recombinase XerD